MEMTLWLVVVLVGVGCGWVEAVVERADVDEVDGALRDLHRLCSNLNDEVMELAFGGVSARQNWEHHSNPAAKKCAQIRYGSRNCSCQQLNDWTTTVRATDKERVKKYTTLFSPLYSWCLLYWLFKRKKRCGSLRKAVELVGTLAVGEGQGGDFCVQSKAALEDLWKNLKDVPYAIANATIHAKNSITNTTFVRDAARVIPHAIITATNKVGSWFEVFRPTFWLLLVLSVVFTLLFEGGLWCLRGSCHFGFRFCSIGVGNNLHECPNCKVNLTIYNSNNRR